MKRGLMATLALLMLLSLVPFQPLAQTLAHAQAGTQDNAANTETPAPETNDNGEQAPAAEEELPVQVNGDISTVEVGPSDGLYQEGSFESTPKATGTPQRRDASEAVIKAEILNALNNIDTSINLEKYNIKYSFALVMTYLDYFEDIINENPQLFYCKTSFKVSYNTQTGMINEIFDIQYIENAAAKREEYEAEINRVIYLAVQPDMSQAEMALALHDTLAMQIRYHHPAAENYKEYPDAFTSYGAIVDKYAVCQGYALAYNDCVKRMGMEFKYVPSEAMNHGWSMVKVDGSWYHVDVTWDDPTIPDVPSNDKDMGGFARHNYFLKTDSQMLNDPERKSWNADALTPVSATSPHPNDSFWANQIAGMHYYKNYWYYSDTNSYRYKGKLVRTAYGKTRNPQNVAQGDIYTIMPVRDADRLIYYKYSNGDLYGSNANDGSFVLYDLATGKESVINGIPANGKYIAEVYAANDNKVHYTECDKDTFSGTVKVYDIQTAVPVTGISISPASKALSVNETATLTANVTPSNATDKSVTWTSSDTAVATVSTGGVVTAKAIGKATITAKTTDGNKTATCTITVQPKAPPIPTIISAKANGASVTVTWSASAGAEGYILLRQTGSEGYTEVTKTAKTSYTDTGLKTNTAYNYRVMAYSGSVKSAWSPYYRVVTSYLAQVVNLKAKSDTAGITLSWDAVAGATGYVIYDAANAPTIYSKIGQVTNGKATYTDTTLAAGASRSYSVRAFYQKDGKYSYGGYADAVTAKAISLAKPTITGAKANGDTITVTWAAVSGADGYILTRQTGSGGYTEVTKTAKTTHTDTGLKTSTKYNYRVVAYKGSVKSERSEYVGATTSYMAKLKNLTAKADSKGIVLNWDAVSGATGYVIYDAKNAPTIYSKIGQVSGGKTIYTDTTLAAGESRSYSVRAYYQEGTKYSYGGYADAVTAKSIALQKPVIQSAKANGDTITVTWAAVSGAEGYILTRQNGTSGYTEVVKTAKTTYTDTGLNTSTRYNYRVVAYSGGIKSERSDYMGATTNALPKINNMAVIASKTGGITIKWDAVEGATGYVVYDAKDAPVSYVKIGTTPKSILTYTDTRSTIGVGSLYSVRAYYTVGSLYFYGGYADARKMNTQ